MQNLKLISLVVTLFNWMCYYVNGLITVHLIPHSHDDVGWHYTVEEYFEGKNPAHCVKCTLNNVVDRLNENPNRTFVEVEMAFFYLYMNQANNTQKQLIQSYLDNGNLEFIGGGFSMNDEACTHFISTIDNMSVGHRFIKENFGDKHVPIIGWQIDPFGHASFLSSAFSEMGYIGELFGRMDYMDFASRRENKKLDFIWRGSASKPQSDLFTTELYWGYGAPPSFNWEKENDTFNSEIIDDGSLGDNHIARVNDFIKLVDEIASHYSTDHVIIPMGNDFAYLPQSVWYRNMDKLIFYANQDPNYNLIYSTPSNYVQNVHKSKRNDGKKWNDTLLTTDLFPYASEAHGYWSGYFTTRPNFKRMERRASNILQAARQIEVMSGGRVNKGSGLSLDNFERAMGVSQHHDAITGNNMQRIGNDYSHRLHRGVVEGLELMKERVGYLSQVDPLNICSCLLINQTRCECTQDFGSLTNDILTLNVYNSLSMKRHEVISVPINTANVKVRNSAGEFIESQIIPTSGLTKSIPAETSNGFPNANNFTLYFESIIPASGFSTYQLIICDVNDTSIAQYTSYTFINQTNNAFVSQDSNDLVFEINAGNSLLLSKTIKNVVLVTVKIDYLFYSAYCEKNEQNDGDYIFRPSGDAQSYLVEDGIFFLKGNLITEIFRSYKNITSVVRTRKGSDLIEVEHTIDSIDISNNVGKEVIVKYSTSLQSNGFMFTDSNGRDMILRQRDFRSTWDLDLTTEPIARNYFPVTTSAFIKDTSAQFTVLVDRAMGTSSLKDGDIEFMLHRRLLCDDGKGAADLLNEIGPDGEGLRVRSTHMLAISDLSSAAELHKKNQAIMFAEPILFFSSSSSDAKNLLRKNVPSFHSSINSAALPESVMLITLQDLGNNEVLLRLGHLYEVDENENLSKEVFVNIISLLPKLRIKNIEEMQLTGVKPKNSIKNLTWGTYDDEVVKENFNLGLIVKSKHVFSFKPMEIKTFILNVNEL